MSGTIISTKKKLSFYFTMIVFSVILFLGLSFFSFKYIKSVTQELEGVNILSETIKARELGYERLNRFFIEIDNRRGRLEKMREVQIGRINGGENIGSGMTRETSIVFPVEDIRNIEDRGFMNYLFVKNGEIISSNIKDNISDELLEEVIDDDKYYTAKEESGFIVKKIDLGNEVFIVFKKLKYSFSDYFSDIILFIIINIVFSIVLYLIGQKFVDRAFVPVEENMDDMRNFVHNAGHELKTPISVIDSNLQLIKDIKKYDEEMVDEMRKEVGRLDSLIETLINLSDIGALKGVDEISLKQMIEEIVRECKQKIDSRNLEVNVDIKTDLLVMVNRDYIYMLLSNIIGNAIKYNKEGGKVNIVYKKGELTVEDTGIGIKKEDISKIFDRFYKGDKSRGSEGFGIGLSLVKKIADIYKWKIKVVSKEGEGTKMKVFFK